MDESGERRCYAMTVVCCVGGVVVETVEDAHTCQMQEKGAVIFSLNFDFNRNCGFVHLLFAIPCTIP